MNVSQAVARVYAEALLDLGTARNSLSRIVDDLGAVRELFGRDRTFREFFGSPRLDPAVKKRVLAKAFAGKLDRPVMGLLSVLVDKRREMVLDNIIAEFEKFRDLREGRAHAHVTSAVPLGSELADEIRSRLERATGKKVKIHERLDPRVLGGLVVRVGDKVLDGSLRRRLERLRRGLYAVRG